VLRYGALPVVLEPQAAQIVSATVGDDALRAGVTAGLIGLALAAVYILVLYRFLGAVALASLAMSAVWLYAIVVYLSDSRGLALTLAGVTGLIVSIGTTLDSNIVYFEHLKEDVREGRSLRSATSRSFESSFRTIVAANMVSLIGAAILYWMTVGGVRGFALFLGLSTIIDLIATWFFLRPVVTLIGRSPWFIARPRLLALSPPGDETPAATPVPTGSTAGAV
jgi:preprotein translocase subunit SecD